MNIAVIGTGYVGLVTGACFSEFGVQVTCVDKEQEKIASMERGEIPIYEPGLDEIVARNVRGGRLSFSTDGGEAIDRALVVFIAVGTPASSDGNTDLRFVEAVAVAVQTGATVRCLRIGVLPEQHLCTVPGLVQPARVTAGDSRELSVQLQLTTVCAVRHQH